MLLVLLPHILWVDSQRAQPVAELIRKWLPADIIAHVQANDRNRRGPGPGEGEDRFGPILAALLEGGYRGTLAVEPFKYIPDGPACVARSIGYLRGVLEGLSATRT